MHDLRGGIDDVDNQILGLLARRRELARQIATEKLLHGLPFYDEHREQGLLADRIAAAEGHDLDSGLVTRVWEQILDDSLRLQHSYVQKELNGVGQPVKVVFQGGEGAYSHLAAKEFLGAGARATFVGLERFGDVADAVEQGRADIAILPVENTTSGSIAEVYDLLTHSRLCVVGEVKMLVKHCLLGTGESSVERIKTILAHPQAVAQCSTFLMGLEGVDIVYYGDTARSGERLTVLDDPTVGAIAGEDAAQIYGLKVLKTNIGNREKNFTRFLALSRSPIEVDLRVPAKTSLVLSVGNEPGSLLEILNEFAREEIPLVKLESRPTPDNPWEETFFLDFDGNPADPAVARALDGVGRKARFLRVLGSYQSSDLRPQRRRRVPAERGTAPVVPPTVEREPVPATHRLASRGSNEGDTIVEVGGVVIGGEVPVLIAGPCAVESREQVMLCAEATKAAGGLLLRGGCFKPRTSPYSFQGLGYEGLDMLAEAGRACGLPTVTEVPAPEHVGPMAEIADVLQIGARNMQNFALLAEVGRSRRPVVLKRGISATIEELLQAAEYILAGGNRQVILCERGIRTFENSTRNTLDIAAVPVLKQRTHLPVIVDPSHAAGKRSLVVPLAKAGLAVGANGLMVEIHPEPEKALSDGPQALRFEDLAGLMG
ncbi:MAG: bifunctional 3-deoxy-7-phosphoheptulonate synthase/chorismate mutase [Actinobacteria bacterium]|nr:bifunctional 3-deoxy-7-phosphoheptulonate synthase/chorismate mutase [Actinomycetota bacterium]